MVIVCVTVRVCVYVCLLAGRIVIKHQAVLSWHELATYHPEDTLTLTAYIIIYEVDASLLHTHTPYLTFAARRHSREIFTPFISQCLVTATKTAPQPSRFIAADCFLQHTRLICSAGDVKDSGCICGVVW